MDKISKNVTYWLGVVAIGLVFGLSLQFVRAWTEPAVAPPGGNVGAPINTGINPQTKAGWLGVTQDLIVGGNVGIGTTSPGYKLDVNGTAGLGQTYLKNSDIYFTNTSHNHTGIGNAAGYAAIENASNYNTLMILGRAGGIGGGRSVSIWDRLDVNGNLCINGDCRTSWPNKNCQFCIYKTGWDDYGGQCCTGGPGTNIPCDQWVCTSFNQETNWDMDDTDNRSGGCIRKYKISCP